MIAPSHILLATGKLDRESETRTALLRSFRRCPATTILASHGQVDGCSGSCRTLAVPGLKNFPYGQCPPIDVGAGEREHPRTLVFLLVVYSGRFEPGSDRSAVECSARYSCCPLSRAIRYILPNCLAGRSRRIRWHARNTPTFGSCSPPPEDRSMTNRWAGY